MPIAYSYTRVSSGQQVDGGGLERQTDMATAWCARHGYALDTTLDLSDAGRSAYKGEHLTRGALGVFLTLAQQRKLGDDPVLLVEAIDRLSRQEPLDALEEVAFALVRAGVQIVDLEDNRTYDRESLRGDGLIILVLKARAAHDYSKRLARRLTAHWQQTYDGFRSGNKSNRGGSGGRHPFWLQLDTATQRWRVLPEKASTVKLLFELLELQGLALTAEELNRRGLPSPAGRSWASDTVARTATDPAVYGALRVRQRSYLDARSAHFHWRKAKAEAEAAGKPFVDPEPVIPEVELIAGVYPVVVPQEQFTRVQLLIQQRRHSPASKGTRQDGGLSLFQGMVHCERGSSVGVTHSNPQRSGPRHYLRCRARLNGKRCQCSGRGWHLPAITAHILRRLGRGVLTHASRPAVSGPDALEQQITAAATQLQRARTALTNSQRTLEEAIAAGSPLSLIERLNATVDARQNDEHQRAQVLAKLEIEQSMQTNRPDPSALVATPAIDLMRAVLGNTATTEQRRSLQQLFRGLGLEITLDGSDPDNPRVGIAGDGIETQWAQYLGDAEPGLLALDTLIATKPGKPCPLHMGRGDH